MKKWNLPTWVLVWIALVLFVLVIFFANRENIENVLRATGLWTDQGDDVIVERDEPVEIQLDGLVNPNESDPALEIDETLQDLITPAEGLEEEITVEGDLPQETTNTSTITLHFILVQQDGSIEIVPVEREIPLGNSHLVQTIGALIEGPTSGEFRQGLLNQIPSGTRLISARVRDGVAFLNFSEDFLYNTLGMEGYVAQLSQIIYTAVQFSTVEAVQILIDGQYRDTIGSEGLVIAGPLRPEDL